MAQEFFFEQYQIKLKYFHQRSEKAWSNALGLQSEPWDGYEHPEGQSEFHFPCAPRPLEPFSAENTLLLPMVDANTKWACQHEFRPHIYFQVKCFIGGSDLKNTLAVQTFYHIHKASRNPDDRSILRNTASPNTPSFPQTSTFSRALVIAV